MTDDQHPGIYPGKSNGGKDPTQNVLDLVEAAIQRMNDLTDLEREHVADSFKHLEERLDRQFAHVQELRVAEAERINAIRAVDVGNVAAAAAVSATQATTLAAQVATSAETLRNQVAAAATASTVALGAALDPIQKDIADLRRAQYEQQGQKAQVIDAREEVGFRNQAANMWIAVASVAIALGGIIIAIILRGV